MDPKDDIDAVRMARELIAGWNKMVAERDAARAELAALRERIARSRTLDMGPDV